MCWIFAVMKFFYDMHIHSCLSPCGDDENTPYNIVNMAKLNGLNIIAVSDHNSVDNLKAVIAASDREEILVVPALELTTAEDVHILCLFEELKAATEFCSLIKRDMLKLQNKPHIFGRQIIYDEMDNIIGEEPNLLIPATNVESHRAKEIVESFGGKAVPAHIDRSSNGMVSVLGGLDDSFKASTVEYSRTANRDIKQRFKDNKYIINSDAHSLDRISEAENYLELPSLTIKEVIKLI